MAKFQEAPKSKASSSGSEKKSPGLLTKIFSRGSQEPVDKTLDQDDKMLGEDDKTLGQKDKTIDKVMHSVNEGLPTRPPLAPAQCVRPRHPRNKHTRLEPRVSSQEGVPKNLDALLDADTETQKLKKSDSNSTLHVFEKVRHRMNAQHKLEGTSCEKNRDTPR